MRFDNPRLWEPPSFLVTNFRGVVLILTTISAIWMIHGSGDVLTCRGTRAEWRCERQSGSLVLDAVGLGVQSLTGPNEGTRTEVVSDRFSGFSGVARVKGQRFRLPSQRTRALAEADLEAWSAWTGAPKGALVRSAPAALRDRIVVWTLTLLGVAGIVATAWARVRRRAQ
jgi:hypothetical protein